ncbi:MAG: acyl-CoA dehydrogenase family protein [Deltaproteobacteria bacterium]|nr:acyl-CoA dehydrogenase family protein [Deltaproteobacteria bacterium]
MSENYFKDNDDLLYYFERGIDWEALVEATELGPRSEDGFKSAADAVAYYREVAEMVGEFVASEIAPQVAKIDREGVRLVGGEPVVPAALGAVFEKIKGLELHGMCMPRELGGMNCPMLMYFVTAELIGRADVAILAHHGFHGGMAMAMLTYSLFEGSSEIDRSTGRIVRTRFAEPIAEILRGDAWGSMDITEPDAGSDMAALKAVGEQDEQGKWYVSGQKIFITSGHAKYHFVIARTEKTGDAANPLAGLKGLSLFLVPAYAQDESGRRKRFVTIDRLEEKLGHHGSVTASLSFDRAPAELIGKRGEGFQHMLRLMNSARLAVGFECLGLCEVAWRLARAYAAERPSMGKTIDKHEIIADWLDEMSCDIQGLRALAMHGAMHEELGQKLALRLRHLPPQDELERKRLEKRAAFHARQARRVTPLVKFLGAEKAVQMSGRSLQIHGGNGYSKEFGAEKLLRDALVMPIYEGTSQIQALMAMKDTLGAVMKNPQAFVRRQAQARWRALSARDPLERRLARVQLLSLGAQSHLMAHTAADKLRSLPGRPLAQWPAAFLKSWDPKRDFAYALLHAEHLTRLLADEAIIELLWAQARRHPDRREACERYLERAEPRCRYLYELITTTGTRLLAALGQQPTANS